MAGRITYHPLTKDTLPLARDVVRRLRDRRRNVVREIDEEISRIEKMASSAGLDLYP